MRRRFICNNFKFRTSLKLLQITGLLVFLLTSAPLLGARVSANTVLVVSPQGPYTTIQDALRDAANGDTVQVRGGTYQGNLVVEKSVVLEGTEHPVLDAQGRGTVVTINAPDVTLRGFEIRNSGSQPDQDHSGVTVNAPRAVIENNRLRQVLFGIFLSQSADSVARGNEITSRAEYDVGRKGDAIRLWESPRVRVTANHVYDARDIVIWYSHDATIENNLVERGRYGVHLMYCDDARISQNRFLNNSVGIYAMYSKNVRLDGNDLRGQRGPSGYALGFKDTDNVDATRNLLVDNRGGIFLDGTPFNPNAYARFTHNVIAFNDIGVTVMPAVKRVEFSDNVMWENVEQLAVHGSGSSVSANVWRGNYWSDYNGLDLNGDGSGDTPYVAEKFFENMTDREPLLRALMYSPAAQALEFAATSFPLVKPQPKLRDDAPRLVPPPLPAYAITARANPLAMQLLAATMVGGAFGIAALAFGRSVKRMRKSPDVLQNENTQRAPAAENGVIVRAARVGKTYGKTRVLDAVSFDVRAGEALALWGPNGAGKTTLVKALLGLIPFDGELDVANLSVKRAAKRVRGLIGYVPQEVMFYDWSVRATLEFYARLKRADTARLDALLEQLGLAAHAKKNVSALSGGLKQRLALALALLSDPPILLLDEPTANLDTQARADYLKLIAALKRRGKTILFASHRLEEVEALADQVLWLDEGRPARVLPLEAWRAEIVPAVELTLWVDEAQRARASELLNAHGWQAHLNGRGTIVARMRAEQKLRALQTLAAQGIELSDFQVERTQAE